MRLLLHCCCGPCSLEVAERLRSLGHEVTPWFFNPSIHPEEELARRQAAWVQAWSLLCSSGLEGGSASTGRPDDPPGDRLSSFLLRLAREGGRRCPTCYRVRLEAAAQETARRRYDAFATTLAISPYQEIATIKAIGEAAARASGVRFLSADLREHYHMSIQRARELQLYRQNYCGCLFSLLERAEQRARRRIERATGTADSSRPSARTPRQTGRGPGS